MEEQKEKKINGFDDKDIDKEWNELLKRGRENKLITDDFLNLLIARIKQGLTTYENEFNSLPNKYKDRFAKLYSKSK